MNDLKNKIFSPDGYDFNKLALDVFRFQYQNNKIYQEYVTMIGTNVSNIKTTYDIPFLPIRFFKTHDVVTTNFVPEIIFASSGTTGMTNSRHLIKEAAIYKESFINTFVNFYGDIKDWCIIGLLPSYLERENSSLVYMVNELIRESNHPDSGFYLYEFEKLRETLSRLEISKQKTLLIGVTFALLDFAKAFPIKLSHTIIMETGGMKGRKKELLREEVHTILQNAFGIAKVHSEYGMAELLSQAYSSSSGIFRSPPWMKILLRNEDDPLTIQQSAYNHTMRGIINIIDLANIYSCSFIATDDLGVLHKDGSFEVLGRIDNSDLRGCNLLVV